MSMALAPDASSTPLTSAASSHVNTALCSVTVGVIPAALRKSRILLCVASVSAGSTQAAGYSFWSVIVVKYRTCLN